MKEQVGINLESEQRVSLLQDEVRINRESEQRGQQKNQDAEQASRLQDEVRIDRESEQGGQQKNQDAEQAQLIIESESNDGTDNDTVSSSVLTEAIGSPQTSLFDESQNDDTPRQSRKRQRNVDQWASVVRKKRRDAGEQYITRKGKVIPAKTIDLRDCTCKLRCGEKYPWMKDKCCFDTFMNMIGIHKSR